MNPDKSAIGYKRKAARLEPSGRDGVVATHNTEARVQKKVQYNYESDDNDKDSDYDNSD
jgi:hypothetical protein